MTFEIYQSLFEYPLGIINCLLSVYAKRSYLLDTQLRQMCFEYLHVYKLIFSYDNVFQIQSQLISLV